MFIISESGEWRGEERRAESGDQNAAAAQTWSWAPVSRDSALVQVTSLSTCSHGVT